MNALLLSGGKGTRLRPLTLETPKCLLPLFADGKPILEYWISTLLETGIGRVFVNVFYLKEKIMEFVDSLPMSDRIFIYDEGVFQNTIGEVLYNLKGLLGERFLVINSDTYVERGQAAMFVEKARCGPEKPICVGVETRDSVRGKSLVELEGDKVTRFVEKPDTDRPGFSWAGICLMDSSIFRKYTYRELIDRQLADGIFQDFPMAAVRMDSVTDIGDSVEAYERAREMLKSVSPGKERVLGRIGT